MSVADVIMAEREAAARPGRVRVAYLLACAPFAAQEQFVLEEAAEMLRHDVDLVLCPLRPGPAPLPGCPPELLPLAIAQPAWSARTYGAALRRLARNPRAAGVSARVLGAAQPGEPRAQPLARNLLVMPKVLSLAEELRRFRPDHIHAHFSATTATAAWILGDLLGVPWSFTAHSPTDITKRNLLVGKAHAASFVRVVSEDGARRMRDALGPDLGRRVRVVPMGVRAAGEPVGPGPERFRRAGATPTLVCVARLIEAKGLRHLVEAVAGLRDRGEDVVCHVAGDGDQREPLRARAAELGVADRVVMHGYVPNREILAGLDHGLFDVAVLPSYSEGVPITLMEAMARDLPVVATDVGGVSELVSPEAGRLVAPRDTAALTDALAAQLAVVRAGGLRGAARRIVAERYCLSRNAQRMRRVFATGRED